MPQQQQSKKTTKKQDAEPKAQKEVTPTERRLTDAERFLLEQVQVTDNQIVEWFESHTPDDEQSQRMARIRRAGAAFAQIIRANTRNNDEQKHAIRMVRMASMLANACVVTK